MSPTRNCSHVLNQFNAWYASGLHNNNLPENSFATLIRPLSCRQYKPNTRIHLTVIAKKKF
jgi:hypothetical protein